MGIAAARCRIPSDEHVLDRIEKVVGERIPRGALRIITDTSDYFRVDYNDVVCVGGEVFIVRGHEREGRFGLDEELKFWVKKAVDLETGRRKVLKLAFFEQFDTKIGETKYAYYRSPKKEARILDVVRGHPNFMQGYAVEDEKGNVLRVLDFIEGPTLDAYVARITGPHEEYFFHQLPGVLDRLIEAYTGIAFLHEHGEVHGDIRRDHIIVDRHSGTHVWIDFDYAYQTGTNPYGLDLYGLGNVLAYVVGKGDVLVRELHETMPDVLKGVVESDLNIVWPNRIMNLAKIFPYIPDSLNYVLMHFSRGAELFYESAAELVEDLGTFRQGMSTR